MSGTLRRLYSAPWIAKAMEPLYNAARDYYVTLTDVGKFCRQHPVRTSLYLGTLATVGCFWKKKPHFDSYTDSILTWSNEVALVPASIRNAKAQRYVEKMFLLHNRSKLYYLNLGVLALLVERRQFPDLKSSPETCSLLLTPWYRLHRNVRDVGVWGQWQQLAREVQDYDINEDEWTSSSSSSETPHPSKH